MPFPNGDLDDSKVAKPHNIVAPRQKVLESFCYLTDPTDLDLKL